MPSDGQRLINKNSLIRNQIPIAKHLLLGAIAASIVTRKAAIEEGAQAAAAPGGWRLINLQARALYVIKVCHF